MPQKANPIDSEAVVGLSILAAQQSGALLAALQGTHERAAGEWQAEWDALPLAFAATAGALGGTLRLMQGLRVFPERMRANLDVDGGLLMAEAAMMALAPVVGRAGAHASVDGSVLSRAGRGHHPASGARANVGQRDGGCASAARRDPRSGCLPG